jgi:acetyl esterase
MILYFHGGGFMVGRSEHTEFLTRKLAAMNNTIVVSVNYRLAPEFQFSVGLGDCVEAYRWIRQHGEELGGDPKRVAVGGDSSGGNFSGVMPLRAAAEGLSLPDAVVMLGPVLDLQFEKYDSFNDLAPKVSSMTPPSRAS